MPLFGPPNIYKLKAKGDVKGLIKALRYKEHRELVCDAIEALGEIGDARAAEPLIATLHDSYAQTYASKALVKIGDASVEPLIEVLKNENERLQNIAADTLGKIGDKRAVEPLIGILKSENKGLWQHRYAAQALGEIGDARAAEPLKTALMHNDYYMRCDVVEALDKLGWSPDNSEAGASYWAIKKQWDKCVTIGAAAVNPLILALKVGVTEMHSWNVRECAAKALGEIGDARAVEPLITAIHDPMSRVGILAIRALGKIGDKRAVAPITAVLNERYLGSAAAEVIGEIGDARAAEPLIKALKKGLARSTVEKILVKIGDAAVEPLIAALKDEDSEIRSGAAYVLEQIGDARAVEPLTTALKDENAEVREATAQALSKLGWSPDKDEWGAYYWVEKKEWDQCVAIGAPAVRPLINVLRDKGYYAPKAAKALGEIGDARAVEPLIAALEYIVSSKSVEEKLHSAAAVALGKIGDARAVEPLVAALKKQYRKHTPFLAYAFMEALVNIGDAAVKPLTTAVMDKDALLREAAIRALSEIGDTALEPLILALKYQSLVVRREAVEFLKKIGNQQWVEALTPYLRDDAWRL